MHHSLYSNRYRGDGILLCNHVVTIAGLAVNRLQFVVGTRDHVSTIIMTGQIMHARLSWLIVGLLMSTSLETSHTIVSAQSASPSIVERVVNYASKFQTLNERHAQSARDFEAILASHRQLRQRLAASENELVSLANQEILGALQQYEARVIGQDLSQSLASMLADRRNIISLRDNVRTTASAAGSFGALAANLEQQLLQVNIAQQETIQRRMKILLQMEELGQRAYELQAMDKKTFLDYIDLADLVGVRCRLELRSARRALEQASADNPGARFALAVTLLRLNELDAADTVLLDLAQHPQLGAYGAALRSERLARSGDTRQAKRQLALANSLAQHPPMAMHRLVVLMLLDEPDKAKDVGEKLAQSRGIDPLAYTCLAVSRLSATPVSKESIKRAVEESHMANDLSGGTHWFCMIVAAWAEAENGNQQKAGELARKAAELAMGEKSELCLTIAASIDSGQPVAWKF